MQYYQHQYCICPGNCSAAQTDLELCSSFQGLSAVSEEILTYHQNCHEHGRAVTEVEGSSQISLSPVQNLVDYNQKAIVSCSIMPK